MKYIFLLCALAVSLPLVTGCQHYQPAPLSADKTVAALEARSLEDARLKSFLEQNMAVAEWPLPHWDLQSLMLTAFYYHPSLEVARADWNLARAGLVTAGGRPNPTVSLVPGYSFNPPSEVSPWFPTISFDVPIETAGKRGYRQARARHLSESARLKIASVAWQVRSNVRNALLDYSAATEHEKLLREQLTVQEQVVTQLDQRFQAGAISSFELTTARVAFTRLQAEWDDLHRQKAEASARLAEAVGIPAVTLDRVVIDSQLELPAETALTSSEIRTQALRTRPDILSALAEYAASQSALQLEIARQYPDVHLGSGYQFDQGEHKWSLSLAMELPVLNQNQGPIAEAKVARAASAARFEALQAHLLGEIDRATANYRGALAHWRQLEHLLAAQRQQRAAIDAQFQAGAADRLDLLNAQAAWLNTQLLQFDGRIKALLALGQLEDAIQRPFPALSALESPPPLSHRKKQP